MNKAPKFSLIALALAMFLGLGGTALAWPQDRHMDMELDSDQRKELRQLHRDMEDKFFEMEELFAQDSVNSDAAGALHKDMQEIRGKISAFWLDISLKYKQDHPEWTPRFSALGMLGGGHGFGMMQHGGHGGWGPRGDRHRGPHGPRHVNYSN